MIRKPASGFSERSRLEEKFTLCSGIPIAALKQEMDVMKFSVFFGPSSVMLSAF
jgi:hypothetical protein